MEIKIALKGVDVNRGQVKFEDINVAVNVTETESIQSNECVLELLRMPVIQKLLNTEDQEDFRRREQDRQQFDALKKNVEILNKRIDSLMKQQR